MDQLLLGTTIGVRSLVGPSQNEPLSPAAAAPRDVTKIGCSPTAPPLQADNALLYLAIGDEEVIEVSRERDSVPRDLLELADHMAGGGLRRWCWQGRPRRAVWAVDRSGRLTSMTYAPENRTIAWARHELGGSFGGSRPTIDDVCSAPGPDGREEVWLIVARTVNGATVRTIEYFERPYDSNIMRVEDACCVDMAARFDLWQSYTVLATDQGGGAVRLVAQGASPFVAADVGREFWLTGNAEAYVEDDEEPAPVKVVIETRTSASQVECRLEGAYDSKHWANRILRVARPTTQISNLSWLEGESVVLNADGRELGPFIVSGGTISLTHPGNDARPAWVARGWVGLTNSGLVRSLPVNGGEGLGSSRTAVGRITGIGVLPDGIASGRVRRVDQHPDREIALNPRRAGDALGQGAPPMTDDDFIPLDTGFDTKKQIEVLTSSALPLSIAGFLLKVESYG